MTRTFKVTQKFLNETFTDDVFLVGDILTINDETNTIERDTGHRVEILENVFGI